MIGIKNHQVINIKDFQTIEKHYGSQISQEIIEFISEYNGLVEDELELEFKHDDGYDDSVLICYIYNSEEIIEELEHISYLEYFQEEFDLKSDYVEPKTLLPIIDVSIGAIYLSIQGQHKDKLYYADNGDFGIIKLKHKLSDIIKLIEKP